MGKISFNILHIGKCGGRLGHVTLEQKCGRDKYAAETPMSLCYTRGGCVPHLTPEVMEQCAPCGQGPTVMQAPLSSQIVVQSVLEDFKRGYKTFVGQQEHLLYTCTQDPMASTPAGYNDKAGISIWPRSGRVQLDAEKFMALQSVVRPDWYEIIADADTPPDASKKRLRKSLDKTTELVERCIQLHAADQTLSAGSAVLVPLVGGHVTTERVRAARAVAHLPADGYVLAGLSAGPESQLLPSVDAVAELVRQSLSVVRQDRVHVLHGAWRPLHVLQLVRSGVDVFDSSYPCLATERGAALTFPLSADTSCPSALPPERLPDGIGEPCTPTSNSIGTENNDTSSSDQLLSSYEISLADTRYREDGGPLVKGCTCYTCRHHKRAYLHHLLQVNELLAPVLLNIHNLHHWWSFFTAVRTALREDTLLRLEEHYSRLELGASCS